MTVRLDILTPIDGYFLLDASVLDGPDTLAADAATGNEWTAVECDATSITARRGGARDGIGAKIDVGTLTVSFLNDPNPLAGSPIRPGLPMRLRDVEEDATLFTGTVKRIGLNYPKGDPHTYITVTAFDAVTRIAGTPRAGADGPEPWQARFERLLTSCPVPYVAPDQLATDTWWDVEHLDGMEQVERWAPATFTADPLNSWIAINDDTTGVPISRTFAVETGRIYDLSIGLSLYDGASPSGVTVTTDAMLEDGFSESSGTDWKNVYGFVRAYSDTITLTVQGPPGTRYGIDDTRLDVRPRGVWAAPIVHESDLASHLDIAANSADVGWYVDREGTVRVNDGTAPSIAHLSDVHEPGDPTHICYTATDVAYDTDEATNTLRFANHSRKDNGETVAVPVTQPPASVVAGDWTSWQMWDANTYVMPVAAWTISMGLRVERPTQLSWWHPDGTQHGFTAWPGRWYTIVNGPTSDDSSRYLYLRPRDSVPPGSSVGVYIRDLTIRARGTYEADDTTLGPYIAHASAATWGEQAEELETAIYTGTPFDTVGEGIEDQAAWLAKRLTDRYATPEAAPSAITVNAAEHPAFAATVEIHDLITITHRGTTSTRRVIGIEHIASPKRRRRDVTLTLMKAS